VNHGASTGHLSLTFQEILMRALSGAIITAGALIGVGLCTLGIGRATPPSRIGT